jgi:ubiquinone/menaquinone biosynthesis C-methylase UbiE
MTMKFGTRMILALAALIIGVSIWWRYAARRSALPCPRWLTWFLENPYTEMFASSTRILDGLQLTPGMRVLDVGAGPGRLTIPAAVRVGPHGEVVALDAQSSMLDRLRTRARARDLKNIRAVQQFIGPGVLEPNVFDRALLVMVLGEIPNCAEALHEIFTALKPGGVLSITEMLPDPHYQRRVTVEHLAQAAGFECKHVEDNVMAYTIQFVKPAPVEETRNYLREDDAVPTPPFPSVTSQLKQQGHKDNQPNR